MNPENNQPNGDPAVTPPQPTVVAPQTPVDSTPPATPLANKNLIKRGVIGAAIIVVAAVGFVAFSQMNKITKDDATEARQNALAISDDMYSVESALSYSSGAKTSSELDSKMSLAENKLADADKKYNAIKDSRVLKDKKVKEKFDAVDKKWKDYIAFAKDSVKDTKAFYPTIIDFTDKTSTLGKSNPTTTAELNSYLSQYKTIVTDTSTKMKSVKLVVAENKKLQGKTQEYLDKTASLINTAQTDLSSGKKSYEVLSDIYDIQSASYDFSDDVYSIEKEIDNKGKQLDPSTEFDALLSALSDLYVKLIK